LAHIDLLDDFDFEDLNRNPFPESEGEGEVVAKYYNLLEAQMAAAFLRTEGIPCFIANEAGYNVMTNINSYVRLHVLPWQLETARQILAERNAQMEPEPISAERIEAGRKGFDPIMVGLVLLILVILFWSLIRIL
jgi:hypothetical protein